MNRERSATLAHTRTPPGVDMGGVPGALMRFWGATRTRGLRLENTLDPLAVPAVGSLSGFFSVDGVHFTACLSLEAGQ
jgi:hypothetical protein